MWFNHITANLPGDFGCKLKDEFSNSLQFLGGVWTLSMILCDGLMTMDVMLCTASIFNLCAISIDRYLTHFWLTGFIKQ